ncbi:MAG: helix-turn-helix transcriptional regulator [Candidatus Nitrosoglobus sp.]|jgi:predicted DNA-binding transcriptional regulator AlpA
MIETSSEKQLLVSSTQLAKRLGISSTTLWRWKRDGILPTPIRIAQRPMWRVADIEAWLTARGEA